MHKTQSGGWCVSDRHGNCLLLLFFFALDHLLLESCNGMTNDILNCQTPVAMATNCSSSPLKMRYCHVRSYMGFRMSLNCSTSFSMENVGWPSLYALHSWPFIYMHVSIVSHRLGNCHIYLAKDQQLNACMRLIQDY